MIYFFALKGVDLCNFADDATPYVCDSNFNSVQETLEHNSDLAIAWFEMHYLIPIHVTAGYQVKKMNKCGKNWTEI